MKKVLLMACVIISSIWVISCTKSSVKPGSVKTQTTLGDKSDMGSGDLAGGGSGSDTTGTGLGH